MISNSAADPRKTTIRKRHRFEHNIFIESFGVKIAIYTTSPDAIAAIQPMLVVQMADTFRQIGPTDTVHRYYYVWNRSKIDSLYVDNDYDSPRVKREVLIDLLASMIRLNVAEFAVDRVFVHSGVVGWKGKGIMFPAKSFSGKSALTAELVRLGAEYYSDEYAVLNETGHLEPFPKMLSIRGEIDAWTQVEYPVEHFGGKAGTVPIPIGLVVITEYKEKAKWNPKVLSSGQGVMAIIKNTVPIRNEPTFALSVLKKGIKGARIIKSRRGDAAKTALKILELLEAESPA